MAEPFKAMKVTDHVYWVGAIDWGIRDFTAISRSAALLQCLPGHGRQDHPDRHS